MGARRVNRTPPPDGPEWMGSCDRNRFLEAMTLDDSAEEPFRADRTLCEPRPNA
jgi:hypothetical protein